MVIFTMGFLIGILGAFISLHFYGLHLDTKLKDKNIKKMSDVLMKQNRAVS